MHKRLLLRGTGIGLITTTILILVAGCEEPLTGPSAPEPSSEPPTATPQYRSADLDELRERWAVLPVTNGAAVPAPAQSERRRAAATDGASSGLTAFYTLSEAKDYGACITFTSDITYPGWPGPGITHVIDCVGEPAPGNPVDGLFHAARICHGGYTGPVGNLSWTHTFTIIFRAGDFQPELGPHPAHDPLEGAPSRYVHTSMQERPGGTVYDLYLKWLSHHPEFPNSPTNWVVYGGYITKESTLDHYLFGFKDIDPETKRLHWSIDHSKGVAEIGEHDWAAVVDFRERCDGLPPPRDLPGQPEPPEPEPDPPTTPVNSSR